MSPESHPSLSPRAARRAEKKDWEEIGDQLGEDRVKPLRALISRMAVGKVISFPVTETRLNVPPAPTHFEQSDTPEQTGKYSKKERKHFNRILGPGAAVMLESLRKITGARLKVSRGSIEHPEVE